jgi:hypothetical protein
MDKKGEAIGSDLPDGIESFGIEGIVASYNPCAEGDSCVLRFGLAGRPEQVSDYARREACKDNYEKPPPFHATKLADAS